LIKNTEWSLPSTQILTNQTEFVGFQIWRWFWCRFRICRKNDFCLKFPRLNEIMYVNFAGLRRYCILKGVKCHRKCSIMSMMCPWVNKYQKSCSLSYRNCAVIFQCMFCRGIVPQYWLYSHLMTQNVDLPFHKNKRQLSMCKWNLNILLLVPSVVHCSYCVIVDILEYISRFALWRNVVYKNQKENHTWAKSDLSMSCTQSRLISL
jgi:hypothetical protein